LIKMGNLVLYDKQALWGSSKLALFQQISSKGTANWVRHWQSSSSGCLIVCWSHPAGSEVAAAGLPFDPRPSRIDEPTATMIALGVCRSLSANLLFAVATSARGSLLIETVHRVSNAVFSSCHGMKAFSALHSSMAVQVQHKPFVAENRAAWPQK
jgi:hypothetical protein